MSEQIHDQVSAFMDDELSGEECAFLVRRLERDPEARGKLIRYSMIGAVLRHELLLRERSLSNRVHEALNGAAPPVRPPAVVAAGSARRKWVHPTVGIGIAATVAMAALFAVRAVNEADVEGIGSRSAASPQAAITAEAPSYVVPRDVQGNRVIAPPPIRLTNYLMHHSEYASRLTRTSVHSNVVGAVDAPALIEASATVDSSSTALDRSEGGVR